MSQNNWFMRSAEHCQVLVHLESLEITQEARVAGRSDMGRALRLE